MPITDYKLTEGDFASAGAESLPDQVIGQAEFVKNRIDAPSKDVIMPKYNSLIDYINANMRERQLVFENEAGISLNSSAQITGGVKEGDVLEIEYNYTSRPYPSETEPTIYDTAFFRFRALGGFSALWPNGNSKIYAYQVKGNNLGDSIQIEAYIRTSTVDVSIMSRYSSPPSGFSGSITNSKLFRLKRVWKILNV